MQRTHLKKQFLIFIVIIAFLSILGGCLTQNTPTNTNSNTDTDEDGLTDKQENILGTNITKPDSDDDSINDFFETENGSAMNTDEDDFINALDADDDSDGIPTFNEQPDENYDGNPSDALDTDKDGTPDYLDTDDDNDTLLTFIEEAYGALYSNNIDNDNFLNYQDSDSDNDGKNDSTEGTGDTDGDEIPNFLDANDDDGPLGDLDDDGITNQEEGSTEPTPPDTDDDGIPDYLDPGSGGNTGGGNVEQAKFLGSWRNQANENEHWIFYSNWTQLYTLLIADDPEQEPYTAELRFNYTLVDNTYCQSVLMGGSTPPTCYPYEFSNQDTRLTLSNKEDVMVVLIKD